MMTSFCGDLFRDEDGIAHHCIEEEDEYHESHSCTHFEWDHTGRLLVR